MTPFERPRSRLESLECSRCRASASIAELNTVCRECGSVLLARYRLDEAARTLTRQSLRDHPERHRGHTGPLLRKCIFRALARLSLLALAEQAVGMVIGSGFSG